MFDSIAIKKSGVFSSKANNQKQHDICLFSSIRSSKHLELGDKSMSTTPIVRESSHYSSKSVNRPLDSNLRNLLVY